MQYVPVFLLLLDGLFLLDSKSSAFSLHEKASIREMKGSSVGVIYHRMLTSLVKDLALETEGANLSKLDEEFDRPQWMNDMLHMYYEVKEITDAERFKNEKAHRKEKNKIGHRANILEKQAVPTQARIEDDKAILDSEEMQESSSNYSTPSKQKTSKASTMRVSFTEDELSGKISSVVQSQAEKIKQSTLDKEIELQRLKNEEQKLKNEEMKLRAEDRQSSISSKLIEAMLAKLPAAAVDDS